MFGDFLQNTVSNRCRQKRRCRVRNDYCHRASYDKLDTKLNLAKHIINVLRNEYGEETANRVLSQDRMDHLWGCLLKQAAGFCVGFVAGRLAHK